jgi:hypothetical protein
MMHRMCTLAGVPEEGWVSVGIHIDSYPIARVIGKNAGCFAGGGDLVARQFLADQRFRTAAVMPMFNSLPGDEQARFSEHERLQKIHLSGFRALPALMDLEQQYRQIDPVGFYKKSVKYHVRPQCFNWLLAALCDVGAELNFVIGWNAGDYKNQSPDVEFRSQLRFLKDHLDDDPWPSS